MKVNIWQNIPLWYFDIALLRRCKVGVCNREELSQSLPAQYADSVDLKGGLLNNKVCTVKFPVIES